MNGIQTVCIISDERVDALALDVRGRTITLLSHGHVAHGGPDSILTEYDSDELADAVTTALRSIDTPADSLTLVIPMQWCFVHRLTPNGKRPTNEALSYELEPSLPIGLEALTCVFVRNSDSSILAIAVPTRPMTELLACLEDRDVTVERLLVDAPLLQADGRDKAQANRIIRDHRWTRGLLAANTQSGGVIVTPTTKPKATASGSTEGEGNDDRNGKTGAITLDLTKTTHGGLPSPTAGNGRSPAKPQAEGAILKLATLAVRSDPSHDLRTGELAAGGRWDRAVKLTTHCLAVAILLLAVVSAGLHLKTRTVRANIATVQAAQLQTYAGVIATEQLPPGAALRLASERVRWQGLTRGEKSAHSTSSSPKEPFTVLREFVAALPGDLRILLNEARIEGGQFVLRGATVSHRDAERISEVLGTVEGVTPRPPRTSRLASGGVEFSITAGVSDGS